MKIFLLSLILVFIFILLVIAVASKDNAKKERQVALNSQLKRLMDNAEESDWTKRNQKSQSISANSPYNLFGQTNIMNTSWGSLRSDGEPFDIEDEFESSVRDSVYRKYSDTIIRLKDDFKVMALPVVREEGQLKIKQFKSIMTKKASFTTEEWGDFKKSIRLLEINGGAVASLKFTASVDVSSEDFIVKLANHGNNKGKLYLTWIDVCKKKTKDYIV